MKYLCFLYFSKDKYPLLLRTYLLLFSVFTFLNVQGSPNWEFKVNGGFSIGASSPLSLPREIREIKSFTPALSPRLGVEGISRINEKWGISTQIALEHKGFEVKDQVKSLYTEMEMKEEKYVGNFTGKNSTKTDNWYVTIPISATYFFSDTWLAQAGFYISFLTGSRFEGTASDGYIRRGSPIGEKTAVDLATFDFSKKQNKTDYGLIFAGERVIYDRLALRGQLSWGLHSLFPSEFTGIPFKMYNIYGTIGVSYRL